jgi:hypothetical protein
MYKQVNIIKKSNIVSALKSKNSNEKTLQMSTFASKFTEHIHFFCSE